MEKRDVGEEASGPEGGVEERVPDALAALWERARPNMMERLRLLQQALGEVERGELTRGTQQEAMRVAHKLAGSLGTYGLMQGSVVAREIETRLEQGPFPAREASWLRRRVLAIDKILHDAVPAARSPTHPSRAQDPRAKAAPSQARRRPEPEKPAVRAVWDAPAASHDAASGAGGDAAGGDTATTAPLALRREVDAVDRGPLDRFKAAALKSLVGVEAVLADLVRGARAGKRAGDRERMPAVDEARLAEARRTLRALAVRFDQVGMDLPAREARGLAVRLVGDATGPQVAPLAGDLLGLHRLVGSLGDGERHHGKKRQEAEVWVVSASVAWRELVGTALQVEGHRVRLIADAQTTAGARAGRPAAVVADVDLEETTARLVDALTHRFASVPLLFAVAGADVRNRVAAGRLGAARVLGRASPARDVAAALRDLVQSEAMDKGRVLVVDDDETILAAVEATLVDAGFEVATVVGPERFWQKLEQWSPELVVTDLDMPGMDGADLCLAMRTDPRWENLPVVFLSSKDDARSLRRVFEAGADDFVVKPLDPGLLVARVQARLSRQRTRLATGHLDPVTRLPTGPAFEDTVQNLVSSSLRQRRPASLAVVRLDHAVQHRRESGYTQTERLEARLGRLLEGRVEPPGLVGRREMDRFVVALDATDLHDAKALLEDVVSSFSSRGGSPDGASASAGLAQAGLHGRSLSGLLEAAEAAREQAEHAGGARVFLAGKDQQDRRTQKVDVLVVDDDPTIGELLVEALSHQGWRVAWEPDSARAALRLSGRERDLSARVVLLDVNMPNMDGLTVLRLLSERGVVPPAKVVMLTVRAREDEVVRALNLGAVDHVAKPFSVPVLVSRVKRAMEA